MLHLTCVYDARPANTRDRRGGVQNAIEPASGPARRYHGCYFHCVNALTSCGLIRIRLPLPDHIRLVDPASCLTDGVAAPCDTAETYALSPQTFTDLWRAVPSILNANLTGATPASLAWPRAPNPQGGYLIDGRAATLQEQARGAFQDHNNSAATLEDVVIHYEELFKRIDALNSSAGLPAVLTTDDIHRDRPNVPAERVALVAHLTRL